MSPSPFPEDSDINTRMAWFNNPMNSNFTSWSKNSKDTNADEWHRLEDLIISVVGLQYRTSLQKLVQEILLNKAPLLCNPGADPATPEDKAAVVDALFQQIRRDYKVSFLLLVEYSRWVKAALTAYLPHQITRCKSNKSNNRYRGGLKPPKIKPLNTEETSGQTLQGPVQRASRDGFLDLPERESEQTPSMLQLQTQVLELTREREHDRAEIVKTLRGHEDIIDQLQRAVESQPLSGSSIMSCKIPNIQKSGRADTFSATESRMAVDRTSHELLNQSGINQQCQQSFEQDTVFHPVSQKTVLLSGGMQMPAVITNLSLPEAITPPDNPNEFFSFGFLTAVLKGYQGLNGRYQIPQAKPDHPQRFPQLREYRLLNPEYEPLVPAKPGIHGAQLSFATSGKFNEIVSFPLFVRATNGQYRYLGSYREPRAPCMLSENEMLQLPLYLKEHWAMHLVSRQAVEAPNRNFRSLGGLQRMDSLNIECGHHLWYTDYECLTERGDQDAQSAQRLVKAFDEGIVKLSYEYLECVGYDLEFFNILITEKREFGTDVKC